jgi:hypothetical protein
MIEALELCMSWTERVPRCAALLLFALPIAGCEPTKETAAGARPASCQQKRALWEAEFPKIAPGPPTDRIKAIEAIADKIGEDPEQCAAAWVEKALQTEKARLVMLRVKASTVAAAAIYTCSNLSKELKCTGSAADDTAHLGASLTAVAVPLVAGERVKLDADATVSIAAIRLYVAASSSLLDAPKYTALTLDESGGFTVPRFSEPMVLFAIVKASNAGIYNKFVWLAKPP